MGPDTEWYILGVMIATPVFIAVMYLISVGTKTLGREVEGPVSPEQC